MIALDTSSIIAFLADQKGQDVEHVDHALGKRVAVFPPLVLSELLSDSNLPLPLVKIFKTIPLLEILPGYWERCGLLRAKILKKKFKARIADTLIAQSCLDHDLPLITRDRDFRHFEKFAELKLL